MAERTEIRVADGAHLAGFRRCAEPEGNRWRIAQDGLANAGRGQRISVRTCEPNGVALRTIGHQIGELPRAGVLEFKTQLNSET